MLKEPVTDLDQLQKLVEEINKWNFEIDRVTTRHVLTQKITSLMESLYQNPQNKYLMEDIISLIKSVKTLGLGPDLWEAQNIYFSTGKQTLEKVRKREDDEAKEWLELFNSLGKYIGVKIM